MNKIDFHNLAVQEFKRFPELNGWRIVYDKAKLRNGQCNYAKKVLSFSEYFVNQAGFEEARLVILHEIAHALTPKQHHNYIWRAKCIEIGGDGKRATSLTDNDALQRHIVDTQPKYILVCDHCGRKTPIYRKIKINKSCSDCYPYSYNEKYKLRLVQVR